MNRPIWMTRPHGTWCTNVHRDTDHPNNRGCEGNPPGVPLSLTQAIEGGEKQPAHFNTIDAGLQQDWREVEPKVVLSGTGWIEELTLAEAERYAALISALVRKARESQP